MTFDNCMRLEASIRRLLLALVWPMASACGDTLHLQNGNTLEGIVTQETQGKVVLDLGTGSMTFPLGSITAIERASVEENKRLREEWKQKYFLHRQYTPADLTTLAAAFTRLVALHEQALGARRTMDDVSVRETRLNAEQELLRPQIVQTNQRLQQAAPARDNVVAYNALVSESNAQQARWQEIHNELIACRKTRDDALSSLAAYQAAVMAFSNQLVAEQKKPVAASTAKERQQFLERLAQHLAQYTHECASIEVPVTQIGGSSIILATINEQVRGRFLLDTGAAQVTLSESFAKRLQLDPAKLPTAEFTMADGRKTEGHVVVLRAMVVGEARAENVEAAILPGNLGEQVDGLLGMSFLKHFSVNFDGHSGKLLLRKFAPQEK